MSARLSWRIRSVPLAEGAAIHIDRFARVLFSHFEGRGLLYAHGSLEICHFRDPWTGVPVLARSRGYPRVYEVNGLPSIELPLTDPALDGETLDKIPADERRRSTEADLAIVPVATLRDMLVRLGCEREKVAVVPNGADLRDGSPPARPANAPASYLLYFGALQPWQGVATLLRAFAPRRLFRPSPGRVRLAVVPRARGTASFPCLEGTTTNTPAPSGSGRAGAAGWRMNSGGRTVEWPRRRTRRCPRPSPRRSIGPPSAPTSREFRNSSRRAAPARWCRRDPSTGWPGRSLRLQVDLFAPLRPIDRMQRPTHAPATRKKLRRGQEETKKK